MLGILWIIILFGTPSLVALYLLGLQSDLFTYATLPFAIWLILLSIFQYPAGSSLKWTLRCFAVLAGFNLWSVIFAYQFKAKAYIDFRLGQMLESPHDSYATFMSVYGPVKAAWMIVLMLAVLAACGIVCWGLARATLPTVLRSPLKVWHRPVLVFLLAAMAGLYSRHIYRFYADIRMMREALNSVQIKSLDVPPRRTGDSVLFLHLESVNATAMFGPGETAETFKWLAPWPGLKQVWSEGRGVWYPYFWANSFATNRGVESILCGISGNLGLEIHKDVTGVTGGRCLPRELDEAGYRTLFLYSFFNLEFYKFAQFLPSLGFKNIVFGDQLMKAGDAKFNWGYDDCTFYRRMGEYFEAHKAVREEPLMAYVEVSMHHSPFGDESRYPAAWPFTPARNSVEKYVNSLSEQDHCLPEFWAAVKKLNKKDLHVFIVGDHSIPLTPGFNLEDRFLTTMLYLPPQRDAREPRMVFTRSPPSQSDLYQTVLDLIYHGKYRYSIAPALYGAVDDGERCSVLANQYGMLAYARAGERAWYSMDEHTVYVEASPDGGRTWRREKRDLSFSKFREAYSCK